MEVCPVCLETLNSGAIGHPNSCRHRHHVTCLHRWTNFKNACPLCVQPFDTIVVDGGLPISIQPRPVVTDDQPEGPIPDDWFCETCGMFDDTLQLIICDGCEKCHHHICVGHQRVPIGDWFCPSCVVMRQQAQAKRQKDRENRDRLLSELVPSPTPTPPPTLSSPTTPEQNGDKVHRLKRRFSDSKESDLEWDDNFTFDF